MISGNENRETAQAIMCLFFKLNFNQRSKFFRDLSDNPLLDKLTDYIHKWYQMNCNNNYIRECFELIHQILSNDQYKGAYNRNFFSLAESNKMLNLQDKFIKFLGVYSDTVSDLLDQILHELCRCFITEIEEKEIEVFLPAEMRMVNYKFKFKVDNDE